MRILIAEDDFTSRATLSGVLAKEGHEVTETTDGLAAWLALQEPDSPRLAILDWMMPGLEGLEVVRRVRTLDGPTPPYVIMLTTRGEKADVIAGLEAGADDYLAKPFDLGELRARVEVGRRTLALQAKLAKRTDELAEALEHVKTLRGIVPICSRCKKMRDDAGYWQQVEAYISARSEALFSHGVCPECLPVVYPPSDYPFLYENGKPVPDGRKEK